MTAHPADGGWPRVAGTPSGSRGPVAGRGASDHACNAVVLALVLALLDLEQRRDRGKVRPPMIRRRSA